MDVNYEGTALGVYAIELEYDVTEPDPENPGKKKSVRVEKVKFPRSNSEFPGLVFFGLDTTTFPDGIVPPVRYGDTEKERAVDTKNAFMHTDDPEYNVAYDPMTGLPLGRSKYQVEYPMPLENANDSCERCELSSRDSGRSVGAFKIGVVTVPGNTELEIPGEEEPDSFVCPSSGDPEGLIFGTPLSPHYGAD